MTDAAPVFESEYQTRVVNDPEELKDKIKAYRTLGKKIVLTSGAFDILHNGHMRYLERAKGCIPGAVLVVGVDSDAKIKKRKGPHRPIVPQEERIEVVAHQRYVDLVTMKEVNDEKWFLIKLVRPDVLISSERTEYSDDELAELKNFCGEVKVLESQARTSTTGKIRLLLIGMSEPIKQELDNLADQIMDAVTKIKQRMDDISAGGA